jgi:hypothetical protein
MISTSPIILLKTNIPVLTLRAVKLGKKGLRAKQMFNPRRGIFPLLLKIFKQAILPALR